MKKKVYKIWKKVYKILQHKLTHKSLVIYIKRFVY